LNNLELFKLRMFCRKHGIDPQEIDDSLTYAENMSHLESFIIGKDVEVGVREAEELEEMYAKAQVEWREDELLKSYVEEERPPLIYRVYLRYRWKYRGLIRKRIGHYEAYVKFQIPGIIVIEGLIEILLDLAVALEPLARVYRVERKYDYNYVYKRGRWWKRRALLGCLNDSFLRRESMEKLRRLPKSNRKTR